MHELVFSLLKRKAARGWWAKQWDGGRRGGVEREKARRVWFAKGREDIERCWICGWRS